MEHISKLPGLRQTYNRAQMTATLHVMKIVPKWAPLQICTDSQLGHSGVLDGRIGKKRLENENRQAGGECPPMASDKRGTGEQDGPDVVDKSPVPHRYRRK